MEKQEIPRALTLTNAPHFFPGITPTAFRRLVLSGEIPSRKIGVKYVFTPEAVERWLQGGQSSETNAETEAIRRIAE